MRRFVIVLSLLFIGVLTFAQQLHSYISQSDSAKQLYRKYAYNKYGYVNGKKYISYYNPIQSTPILESKMSKGTIYYNGFEYSELNLSYDTYIDELIATQTFNKSVRPVNVQINKSKVDSFLIKFQFKSYLFKNLTFKNHELPDGYYEIAYSGKCTLIIKHFTTKSKEEGITMYNPKIQSYLLINNNINPINKKKELLSLYYDHKKKIKKKIRQYITPYKKLTNNQLTDLMRYIESL